MKFCPTAVESIGAIMSKQDASQLTVAQQQWFTMVINLWNGADATPETRVAHDAVGYTLFNDCCPDSTTTTCQAVLQTLGPQIGIITSFNEGQLDVPVCPVA